MSVSAAVIACTHDLPVIARYTVSASGHRVNNRLQRFSQRRFVVDLRVYRAISAPDVGIVAAGDGTARLQAQLLNVG